MGALVIDQEGIRKQFDYLCKLVLRGERCTYIKQILRRAEKEIPFSDMSVTALNSLHTRDEYPAENAHYSVMGYTIEVRDDKLAAAIDELTPIKRDIVLLSFFMNISGVDIAKLMGRDVSTVNYHRRRALVLLKKSMETNEVS